MTENKETTAPALEAKVVPLETPTTPAPTTAAPQEPAPVKAPRKVKGRFIDEASFTAVVRLLGDVPLKYSMQIADVLNRTHKIEVNVQE